MADFPFRSYCWALGTTSFRTSGFNVQIECQLDLLDRFRTRNSGDWRGLQIPYYRFMQSEGFVSGDAPNPAKDAREKTTGLVKLGLIDGDRRLTAVGKALLTLSRSGNFGEDNALQISNDSFIYLKQLLKTSDSRCGTPVRPYAVLAYLLTMLGELSMDEYTYLLPLCVNAKCTADIVTAITRVREGKKSIDDIIVDTLLGMTNYETALWYFLERVQNVTADVIMDIGMNRKSGSGGMQGYDMPLFDLYETLHKIAFDRAADSVPMLLEQCGNISGNTKAIWRKHLFRSAVRSVVERDKLSALNDIPILRVTTEHDFRTEFFRLMHLFKAKATLADYADLNRRYFQTTDTVIFADGKVELDILPKVWLETVKDKLLDIAFVESDNLTINVDLPEIAPFLAIDERKLYAEVSRLFGITINTANDAATVISDERHKRFNTLIDEHFDKNTLIDLFGKFENREDDAIRKAVTDNANIPTIFEYILGIAWYQISGRRGKILDYMNLSLEADLLPRSHAMGGNADIEYLYEQTAEYTAHCLLVEATLTDNTNQRRQEMESVSRHLGEHIIRTGNKGDYCVFVSTYLDINVINDFRGRKLIGYIDKHTMERVTDMKIIPLETKEIQTILRKDIDYSKLYTLFDAAYQADTDVTEWYEMEIKERI